MPEERAVLNRSLARQRRDASLEEAREALLDDTREGRRRLLTIARSGSYGAATRGKAAFAVVAPGLARRLMLRRTRREWVGAGGTLVQREAAERG